MATKKSQSPAVEETVANPTPAVPAAAGKEPNLKQTKVKRPRKPRAPASHPPYSEMIGEAIATLKEKTGSSQYAITKFIEEKHKDHIPSNFKKLILYHLRKLSAAGKLVKVKNSYKLPVAASSKVNSKQPTTKGKSKVVIKPKRKTKAAPAKVKPLAAAKVTKPKPKTVLKKKPVVAKSMKKVKNVEKAN